MQHNHTLNTDASPVASRTRQAITAAAARAALNADHGILVLEAARIALKSRVGLPEPITPLTLEEVRAAIPEHGIMLPEFFKLFISRITSVEDNRTFLAYFRSAAVQDPVTQLVFLRPGPPKTPVVREFSVYDMGLEDTYSSQDISHAATRAAQNSDESIYMGGAARATRAASSRTSEFVPMTLGEIRAAIPVEGISIQALIHHFYARLRGRDAIDAFVGHVKSVARQDPVTNLVFLKT